MRRVGIIGCGAIGTALALALERDYATVIRIVALVDQVHARAFALQQHLSSRPAIVSLSELIRRSHLVIESASVAIASRVAQMDLAAGREVLIMSSGGLLMRPRVWQRAAHRSRGRLYVPSGGLCGLDGLKAMAVGRIRRIQLTTRKPPAALASAPGVKAKRLTLARLRRPTIVFEGSPRDVVRAFPQNANVAATMMLAGLSTSRSSSSNKRLSATVRVVADPTVSRNVHELIVEGDAGRIQCQLESRPSDQNPKTSELAIRSALVTLRQLLDPIHIGT